MKPAGQPMILVGHLVRDVKTADVLGLRRIRFAVAVAHELGVDYWPCEMVGSGTLSVRRQLKRGRVVVVYGTPQRKAGGGRYRLHSMVRVQSVHVA